jgi:hypothetical protein
LWLFSIVFDTLDASIAFGRQDVLTLPYMMTEQLFALLNQWGLHNIDLPRYCNLGLGHAFRNVQVLLPKN